MTGLKRHEPHWEVTDDVQVFFRRTGMLYWYAELEWLGFNLNNVFGLFDNSHRGQLEKFCEENPEYHIMTTTAPGLLVNQYVPAKDNLYHLARGDRNPNLVLDDLLHKNAELFLEEGMAKALAMVSDMDDRNKSK